jgi:uncharacterized protein
MKLPGWVLFIGAFLLIYGGAQAFIYWRISSAYPRLGHWRFAVAAFLAVAMVAPVIERLTRNLNWGGIAWTAEFVGYPWMAITVWFLSLALAAAIWNLVVRLTALAAPGARALVLEPRIAMPIFAGVIAFALIWGIIEASWIQIVPVHIKTARLPAGSKPITIAQIADIHLAFIRGDRPLRKAMALIREAKPDALISTGDLPELPFHHLRGIASELQQFQPPLGKYAVTGNHEFINGWTESRAFLEAAGLEVLRGRTAMLGEHIRLAGVDDPACLRMGDEQCYLDETAVLAQQGSLERPFTILLKHQPVVKTEALGRFDLQMSGHTHGGQFFPFCYIVWLFYPLHSGIHELGQGSAIYVNRGTGTWGPPVRVFAPPEVTLFVIEPAS